MRKPLTIEERRKRREAEEAAFDAAIREWLDNRTEATTDSVYRAALVVYGAKAESVPPSELAAHLSALQDRPFRSTNGSRIAKTVKVQKPRR